MRAVAACLGRRHALAELEKRFPGKSTHCLFWQVNGNGFNASYRVAQLQNQTYDNSNRNEPHTYAYAQDFAQARCVWASLLCLPLAPGCVSSCPAPCHGCK